jgi:tRNA modification GTPase
MSGDTIIALASPPGTSGLAVVRLSGPAALPVARLCLRRSHPLPRHMHHGCFRVPSTGEILDRLNFAFLPGPGTATGEDVLEIFPHGNMLLVDRILETVLDLPASDLPGPIRLAGPGEFTRRALENGKVDLLQAEAVGELIHAQTVDALRNAQRIASGELAAPLAALRDSLVDLSVRMELDVDFSEEEADPDYPSWLAKVEGIREALARLSRGFERGRLLARTPRVVLMGAPNAGKSSLVNALVEADRLLVSAIPGTTRDYVEVPLRLPGGMVHLVDTAGLGRPVDGLDELAMERTRAQGTLADLLVWVVDGTGPQLGEEGLPPLAGASLLKVRTKKDLPGFSAATDSLAVSNRTREGLADLLARLQDLLFESGPGGDEDVRLATERQYRAVEAARERMEAAHAQLKGKPAIEILAFEIREAARSLRDLLGEIPADEVLRKVFAGFCIGK